MFTLTIALLLIPAFVAYATGNILDGWFMKTISATGIILISTAVWFVFAGTQFTTSAAAATMYVGSGMAVSFLLVFNIAQWLKGWIEKIAMLLWLGGAFWYANSISVVH